MKLNKISYSWIRDYIIRNEFNGDGRVVGHSVSKWLFWVWLEAP